MMRSKANKTKTTLFILQILRMWVCRMQTTHFFVYFSALGLWTQLNVIPKSSVIFCAYWNCAGKIRCDFVQLIKIWIFSFLSRLSLYVKHDRIAIWYAPDIIAEQIMKCKKIQQKISRVCVLFDRFQFVTNRFQIKQK